MENKTIKTPTKQEKETKKKSATRGKQLDHCVVVFSNGQCELFESEDEARIQQQSLPDGMVKEFKVFPSLAQAKKFIKLIKSRAEAECDTEEPLMPGTEDGDCASKIAAVTSEKKNVLQRLVQ